MANVAPLQRRTSPTRRRWTQHLDLQRGLRETHRTPAVSTGVPLGRALCLALFVGFEDRLERSRREKAEAERAQAQQASRARAARSDAARTRGAKLIPEVRGAARALRADRERSERQLMPRHKGGDRYGGVIGAIVAVAHELQPGPWYQLLPTYLERTELTGWWIRYKSTERAPFELEVPLTGEPRVIRYSSSFGPSHSDETWTLEAFVEGGLYEYPWGGHSERGPVEYRVVAADEVLLSALGVVHEHLLHLPA